MIRLALLGTGNMARHHAENFAKEPDVQVVAAIEPNAARLTAFADKHGIQNRFADLDSALAWGGFDAAANVTPDSVHYATTMQLMAAGKPVFCEKPLATDYPLAEAMADAAEKGGLINMVNLTFRSSPSLQKARAIVESGEIGEVVHFEASYLQSWLVGRYWGDWRTDDTWLWRLSTGHGSKGVVGDIGIHTIDYATFAAGSDVATLSSRVKTFRKADGDRIGAYTLDANDSFVMAATLENGALGTIQATRWATGNANDLRLALYGTRGALRLWSSGPKFTLSICAGADIDIPVWREVECPPVPTTFQRFAAALRTGVNGDPDFRRAANIQRVLDHCLASSDAGVVTIA